MLIFHNMCYVFDSKLHFCPSCCRGCFQSDSVDMSFSGNVRKTSVRCPAKATSRWSINKCRIGGPYSLPNGAHTGLYLKLGSSPLSLQHAS